MDMNQFKDIITYPVSYDADMRQYEQVEPNSDNIFMYAVYGILRSDGTQEHICDAPTQEKATALARMLADKMLEKFRDECYANISSWDWSGIRERAEGNIEWDRDAEQWIGSTWLGTIFGLTPSGKIYAPFACSNVTEIEAERDEVWREVLEKFVSEETGMFVDYRDDNIHVCLSAWAQLCPKCGQAYCDHDGENCPEG